MSHQDRTEIRAEKDVINRNPIGISEIEECGVSWREESHGCDRLHRFCQTRIIDCNLDIVVIGTRVNPIVHTHVRFNDFLNEVHCTIVQRYIRSGDAHIIGTGDPILIRACHACSRSSEHFGLISNTGIKQRLVQYDMVFGHLFGFIRDEKVFDFETQGSRIIFHCFIRWHENSYFCCVLQ